MNIRLILGALILLVSGQVGAAIVAVDWTGTVSGTPFVGTVDVGDTITGSWSYDSEASGSAGGIQSFYFTGHDSSFSVSGFSGSFSDQMMSVINRDTGSGDDQIDTRLNSSTGTIYTGDLISGFMPLSLQVRFTDSTGSVFPDLSLPSALNASDFDNIGVSWLRFPVPGVGTDSIAFRIDSFIATSSPDSCSGFPGGGNTGGEFPGGGNTGGCFPGQVPIPATVWLFGTGLIGLIGFSKRRKAA